jgi:hypothetical protein
VASASVWIGGAVWGPAERAGHLRQKHVTWQPWDLPWGGHSREHQSEKQRR